MASVTIAQSYFEALLRRAEFHTSDQDFLIGSSLSNNVIISKAEHDRLLQTVRQYNLLKSALFRGGLTQETLETLLQGESNSTTDNLPSHANVKDHASTLQTSTSTYEIYGSPRSSDDATHQHTQARDHANRTTSFDRSDSMESFRDHRDRIPVHDQRSVFITNLPEHTTHKDLVGVVRGGRLLDIFLRSDRSATISFVEGAANFLFYAKRSDLYLHTKRLEVRWADRQFHVPEHVSRKIACGATRNLVIRGGAGKFSTIEIRDHLDHIHNLVVVDIYVRNTDVFISTNSIHNALFARTCMMSRKAYKGLRVEYYPDECASPLPLPKTRTTVIPAQMSKKTPATANIYALLDTGSEGEAESDAESYLTEGIKVNHLGWAEATTA